MPAGGRWPRHNVYSPLIASPQGREGLELIPCVFGGLTREVSVSRFRIAAALAAAAFALVACGNAGGGTTSGGGGAAKKIALLLPESKPLDTRAKTGRFSKARGSPSAAAA